MSDKPLWVRWYSTDMLGSARVATMTRDEEYLYRRLLDYQASAGYVNPDPARLAHACKMTPEEFARTWAAIADCFEEYETGRFRNKRMHAERERVFSAVSTARANGQKGGRPAGGVKKADSEPGGSLQETGWLTHNEPGGKAIREPRAESREGIEHQEQAHGSPSAPARKRASFKVPHAVAMLGADAHPELVEAWRIWVEHLWQRKKPTESALAKHVDALAKIVAARGHAAAVRLLDEAIAANSQGLQPWAIQAALNPPTSNGYSHRLRGQPSIMDLIASGEVRLRENQQ